MTALAHSQMALRRRAPLGHGGVVYPAYWFAAAALVTATALGIPLSHPAATVGASIIFIVGGLPHGAYDIELLRRAAALDWSGLALAFGSYVALGIVMVSLWMTRPLVALLLFLVVSAVHFGEDWDMLDEPLLRFAAGVAVVAAATIGHPAEVATLFVAMSDPRAAIITQIIIAAAPVTLLVTTIGIVIVWRDRSRNWAAAMTLCLLLLVVLPPVVGFALFFVFLHSPRHLARTRALLCDMTHARWLGTGALLSGLAVIGWLALQAMVPPRLEATIVVQGFQLLASVAAPHLLLSRWLDRRLPPVACSRKEIVIP